MERFKNAKTGDMVYCRLNGDGVVSHIQKSGTDRPLSVVFSGVRECFYTLDGYYLKSHVEPTLFYREGEEHYLTERPESDVDWSTVEPGTVCLVTHCKTEPYQEREFLCYLNDHKWFVNKYESKVATVWNYARIK